MRVNEMNVNDYRKAYEAELAANADGSRAEPAAAQPTLSPRADLSARIPQLLATLRDPAQPIAARLAALKAISAARFLGGPFAPYRVDFLNVLRQIAQPGVDRQLSESALA